MSSAYVWLSKFKAIVHTLSEPVPVGFILGHVFSFLAYQYVYITNI